MKLVVAVGGASGSIYAKRILDVLAARHTDGAKDLEVGVVFSSSGAEVWKHELGDVPAYPFKRYGLRDFHAPFASGSAGWDAMVVVPCSTGGLARIAHGVSDNLIGRAADVMLKERRKLVLVVREMPLSSIHIENMLTVTRAGAVVLPASPSFYSNPTTIEALLDTVVGRVLDQLGLPNSLMPRWGADPKAGGKS
ncbi:MAG TPA: UbiX family flavin prenyltransferase [Polyangia bacterium]|nr:UbiX family flavin prenyltransferase [Polyangia bacterium]